MHRATRQLGAALSPTVIDDLCTAMSRRLLAADGALASAPDVRGPLAACDDAGRGDEAAEFVRRVGELTGDARRDFAIALHPVQVRSKLWLIDELAGRCDLASASLVVLGGWYGILPLLMNWRLPAPPRHMLCVDLDPAVCDIGAAIVGSRYPNVEYRCADLTELDYDALLAERPGTVVVNTSCEHVPGLADWWEGMPPGQLAVLQSNNHEGCPDHVNCVHDVEQFKRLTPMSELLFAGVLHVAHDLDRYMLIGRR